MPLTVGINHVTTTTADLDRLVRFYFEMFGAEKVFEGAETSDYARMAIVDLGGSRYLKVVEDLAGSTGSAARMPTAHAATERFGLERVPWISVGGCGRSSWCSIAMI